MEKGKETKNKKKQSLKDKKIIK